MTPKSPGIIISTAAARLFQRNNSIVYIRIFCAGKGFMPFLKKMSQPLKNIKN